MIYFATSQATSFNGEPQATVLYRRKPQATSFNGEPQATVLYRRKPATGEGRVFVARGEFGMPQL